MHASLPWVLSVGIVAALGAAGLAWHECMLLAAAAVAAHRLFLWRMDIGAPWDAWRAAVRCVFAGLLGLLGAAALFALIGAGLAGYWPMGHANVQLAVMLLAVAAALLIAVQVDRRARLSEARFWVVLIGGVALAFAAANFGFELLPCLAAGIIGAWLARASWYLARTQAGDLFRSDRRM